MIKELRGELKVGILSCTARAPYDGCWHELNHWLVKGDRIYPIYVSGPLTRPAGGLGLGLGHCWVGFLIKDIEEQLESAPQYLCWEFRAVDEAEPPYNFLNIVTVVCHAHELPGPIWRCDICDRRVRGLAKFLGYQGNGGVGIELTAPCCPDCFEKLRWCDCCFEYVIPEGEGVCPACDEDEEGYPKSHPARDEALQFGLDGAALLALGGLEPPPLIVEKENS